MSHQPKPAGGQRNRNRNYYSVLSDTTEQENPPQLSQGAQSVHIASSLEQLISQTDIDSINNSRPEPQQVQQPAGSISPLRLHGFFTIIPRRVANMRSTPRDTAISPSATPSLPLSNHQTAHPGGILPPPPQLDSLPTPHPADTLKRPSPPTSQPT